MSFSDEQWIGRRGQLSHPDSPAGIGGLGRFRSVRCYGRDCDSLAPYPDPRSPKGRNTNPEYLGILDEEDILFAELDVAKRNKLKQRTKGKRKKRKSQPKVQDKRQISEKKKAKSKKPPTTQPKTYPIRKNSNGAYSIQILADGKSQDTKMVGAYTKYEFASNYSYHHKNDGTKITSFTFKFTGTVTIQTTYGPSANANQPSLYGRGTTEADMNSGNITLGFHEYCHRIDFFNYFKKHLPPDFTGKVGMTISAWNQAIQKFDKELEAYKKKSANAGTESFQDTDEVGYKKSQCQSDGKCK